VGERIGVGHNGMGVVLCGVCMCGHGGVAGEEWGDSISHAGNGIMSIDRHGSEGGGGGHGDVRRRI
jgi:hypothetical protein